MMEISNNLVSDSVIDFKLQGSVRVVTENSSIHTSTISTDENFRIEIDFTIQGFANPNKKPIGSDSITRIVIDFYLERMGHGEFSLDNLPNRIEESFEFLTDCNHHYQLNIPERTIPPGLYRPILILRLENEESIPLISSFADLKVIQFYED